MNALIPYVPTPDLLGMDARALLEAFGAGNPTPGSGSAAALSGALACEVIATGARLTITKTDRREEGRYVLSQVAVKRRQLQKLVQRDTDVFSQVIIARHARDAAKDSKVRRGHAQRARRRLAVATEVAVKIARECLSVAKLGLTMLKIGYKAALGEPACGVSSALAGAQSAIWIILFNLKGARGLRARKTYSVVQAIWTEMAQVQTELAMAVAGLRQEVDKRMSQQLELF